MEILINDEKIDFELPQFENLRIENEEAEFDSQFLRIFRQLKEIHKLKNPPVST